MKQSFALYGQHGQHEYIYTFARHTCSSFKRQIDTERESRLNLFQGVARLFTHDSTCILDLWSTQEFTTSGFIYIICILGSAYHEYYM